jgi:hypothetical protein
MVAFAGSARPATTTVPPFPTMSKAAEITASATIPTVTIAWPAPWPQDNSFTFSADGGGVLEHMCRTELQTTN